MAKPVTFWFEFASPYSYLSALRIENAASERGVELEWKPFLLGPIFKSQGWETSPFSIYEAKGQNMWRDVERRAEKYGIAFKRPDLSRPGSFPQNGLLAARAAIAARAASRLFCGNEPGRDRSGRLKSMPYFSARRSTSRHIFWPLAS